MNQTRDFNYYHKVITSLSKKEELKSGNLLEGLRIILQETAKVLETAQVGFWSFHAAEEVIKNELTFRTQSNDFSTGGVVSKQLAPLYFSEILFEQVISANNVFEDQATSELIDAYLKPQGIWSLLDVPVMIEGEFIGIICCEHKVTPRIWSSDEKYFVTLASHLIAHLIESDRRGKLLRLMELENLTSGEVEIKNLLKSLPIPLAVLDSESRYLAFSEKWQQSFAFKLEAPIGRHVWDCHENYQKVWVERVKLAQTGQRLQQNEELIKGIDGLDHWISWQLEPLRNFQGQQTGVVVICDDITSRKESDIKFNQTAKLTALGEMAGGIAHEINNPLSILKGFVDLMQKKINQGQFIQAEFENYLQKSSSTINRISRVVRAMKKISRDSSQDPLEDTSLNLLIEDARDFMAEKFKSREIDFIVNLPREDVIVSCRTVEISQVLLNLLNNSFQAIDEKGWVRIDVIIEPRIRIIITDSGPGIASELQDKIFQPFFTTKDVGLGTGLGLSISRKMIEGHNGTLRLNPEAKNTQFIIEL